MQALYIRALSYSPVEVKATSPFLVLRASSGDEMSCNFRGCRSFSWYSLCSDGRVVDNGNTSCWRSNPLSLWEIILTIFRNSVMWSALKRVPIGSAESCWKSLVDEWTLEAFLLFLWYIFSSVFKLDSRFCPCPRHNLVEPMIKISESDFLWLKLAHDFPPFLLQSGWELGCDSIT